MAQFAVMNIEKGEKMVMGFVSGVIPGSGRYKFLAKKNKAGKYEWAHFIERDSGLKEKVYHGEVSTMEDLKSVLEIMNRNLIKIFGTQAEMKTGSPEFRSLQGKKFDDTIN